MTQRTKHLKNLQKVSNAIFFDAPAEECFRILYGLPANAQLDLALFMIKRYLSIFSINRPKAGWVRSLINNPESWLKEKGETIPNIQGKTKAGDSHFINALYDLLFAFNRKNNSLQLTSACCSAILNSIAARMGNVWTADDPESIKVWENNPIELCGRTMFDNKASLAVSMREWNIICEKLKELPISEYPDMPKKEIEKYLQLWKDKEFLIISDKTVNNIGQKINSDCT